MVVISYAGKEANAKIVYYGPGLGGKTSNLEFIYDSVPSSSRGKMVSMKTQTDRTLFFDFLPLDLGELGGFRTRFLLYTVPGQVFYNATRKLVLRGADAIAFIADSQVGKMDENKESLANLEENLAEYDLSLDGIPWVIQYNKRDLSEIYSIEELNKELNPRNVPYFEGIATEGVGVFETFRGLSKLLLEKLSNEIGQRLVMAKTLGPKTEDQRAKAVEKILAPLTGHVEIPEVGKPAGMVEVTQAAEMTPAADLTEPLEAEEELEPQVMATDETAGFQLEAEPAGRYFEDGSTVETAPEEAEAVLEEQELMPEAASMTPAQPEEQETLSETLELTAADSPMAVPEAPDMELVREHEAAPNFFTRSLASARLELERDTAHFAEAHDYAQKRVEPEAEVAPKVRFQAAEPVVKLEPARQPEPSRPVQPVAQAVEEPVDEECSFLNIIRRNNVGVFEKTAARTGMPPVLRPVPVVEAPAEKRSIESSIEIPLPLKPGEKMQEVTLTIRIRLKPVYETSGAAEQEFTLDGISR